jgi:hypothetical protein
MAAAYPNSIAARMCSRVSQEAMTLAPFQAAIGMCLSLDY